MQIDWNDPAARLRLAEQIGPEAYNEALRAHREASIIETVNGKAIRPVMTRFGRLYSVDDTTAFATKEEARAFANGAPLAEQK